MGETSLVLMVIIIIVLLACSAYFSGSETALMAISRMRLKHLAETRPRRAKLVEKVLKKPDKLIGAILLGNNLVNVGMSALATAFAISIWGDRGIVYVTGFLTFAILIFAEITPKVYAKYFNESVSFVTAPILNVIMIIFNPFVLVMTFISNKLLSLIGVDVSKVANPLMTEEEILTSIKMGWGDGTITTDERKMLSRVFTLNDRTVGEIMIPKGEMVVLDADASVEEIYNVILRTGHTRFPISKGQDLDIIGSIHAKDLFHLIDEKKTDSLKDIIRPAYFVRENKTIDLQLRSFQNRRLHQAIVQDEGGEVIGLVTIEDIIEELVGSIQDEHD